MQPEALSGGRLRLSVDSQVDAVGTAVLGLGDIATPEAKDALTKRLAVEDKLYLRETIQKSLGQ